MRRHILSFMVENHAGVLSRISGLFSRRGYNIESISAGRSETKGFTRITVAAIADDIIIKQIIKQIEKLVDVNYVMELVSESSVYRELALVKINAGADVRAEIVGAADIFRANVIDVSPDTIIVEITGTQEKIDAFLELASQYGIIETARTGITALQRGRI